MTTIDTYQHLNEDSKLEVSISIPDLAMRVCALNYGAHRMLSAMVHELRERHRDYVERQSKDPRFANYDFGPSHLADGIEALLNQGHTH